MIKILRITGNMNPAAGGIAQGIRNIASVINEKTGINLTVLSFVEEGARLKDDNFDHIIMGPGRYGWCYDERLKPFLEKNLPNFDIVIMNGIWLYPSKALTDTMEKLRKKGNTILPKVYMMPHGMLDPWFQTAETRKLKAFRNEVYWRLVERKVLNNADAILFTCQKEMELAQNTFPGYRPKREINLGYGIPTPPDYLHTFKIAFANKVGDIANKPYWLFMSRLHEKKGLEILIKAYLKLHEQNSHENIPLLLVAGPGENSAYGQAMKELVATYPTIQSKVIFTGMLTGDAKWGALYGCEALLLPSQQENFGIIVVEALACGKPVLISKEVNIWLEIEKYHAGFFCEYNLESLLSELSKLLQTRPNEKEMMGSRAYECFLKEFEITAKAKDFHELLIKPILESSVQ